MRAGAAVAGAGVTALALSLFVRWWERPSDGRRSAPVDWISPADNILPPLLATAALALLLAVLVLAGRRVRWAWLAPFLLACLTWMVAAIELLYLEVVDDARPGMALGALGLVLVGAGSLVAMAAGPPPRRDRGTPTL